MKYPLEIENLIEAFKKYPGIGNKTAERLAIHTIIKLSEEDNNCFIDALKKVKELKRCEICHNLTMENKCKICQDQNRDHQVIMVIEDVKDLLAIEKTESFKGVYHILDGVINFQAGIDDKDLNMQSLFIRAKDAKEIILATNLTVEGEITAQYIYEMLKDQDIIISRIAHGLPVGGDLEYADNLTLIKALEGRRNFTK